MLIKTERRLCMSLEPEELRRRRQHLKLKRQMARKKMIFRLCIAGAILLICGGVILGFSLHNATPTAETPTEPPQSTTPSETEPAATVPPPTVIHFAATGDLNITDKVIASGGENYDYTNTFLDVAHLLADADLATVNLEGNLCGSPYGSTASAPQGLVQSLKTAGVDMIQLANSYSIHRGISGLMTTIDSVRGAGLEPLGVFKNQDEYEEKQGFSMFEVQGVRIAVVSFTKGMDGTALPPGNENCVNILYSDYDSTYQKVDKEKIKQVMESVQAQKPDITIALLHWGSEYNDTVSNSQKSITTLLQSYGADAIIGTHPHYVRQIDYDPQAGTLVAYSLGDFIGDVTRAGTEYSIILDLEITKDHATGEASITGFSYTPIFTITEEGKPLRVVRIREAMAAFEAGYIDAVSQKTYDAMAYALMRIEQRVNEES